MTNSRDNIPKDPCESCKQDLDFLREYDCLNKKNKEHVKSAKKYCERHINFYSDTSCTPIWCKKCGYLKIYEIVL
jgi:hypothetical protein